jgi:ATP-binding cassette subfamily B protein
MSLASLLRRLWSYLRPHPVKVTLLAFGMMVDTVFHTLVPLTLPALVDRAILPGDHRLLARLLALLGAGLVTASLVAIGRDYLYARLSAEVQNELRVKMFEHLQGLSLDFFGRTRPGDVLARFGTDLAALEGAIVSGLPNLVICALSIVWSSFLLFRLEWRLALLTVLGLPLCLVGPRLFSRRASAAGYLVRGEEAVLTSEVHENVLAQPVVKAFGLQASAVEAFRYRTRQLFARLVRFHFLSALVSRTPTLGAALLLLAVVGTGAVFAIDGRLTVGSFLSFYALFQNVSASVSELSSSIPSLLQAAGGVQRIDELLAERPRVVDRAGAGGVGPLQSEITFEDVSFGYGPSTTSLSAVRFTIPRGTRVAFVGPSGSGKSTILRLLARFHDPDQGRVRYDGRDLRELAQDSLRAQVGIVFQESFLFDASVLDNIRVGRPAATPQEVEDAARRAEIHDAVMAMPEGYLSPVGDRGGRLSGGQRQRIALARALLRQPSVLLLDEATSALDPATEAAVNDTVARLAGERTVVSVTHRLASVVEADRLFVMEAGRLVEEGTHPELLARQGVYRQLWDKQSGLSVSLDGAHAEVSVGRLKGIAVLSGLGDPLLAEMATRFVTERYPEGRRVIHEGDPGDKFYIVARGKVAALRRGTDGAEQRLGVMEDGDHFGEIALLQDLPRTASVDTLEPSLFLTLERGQFFSFLERTPGLREQLLSVARKRHAFAPAHA